MQDQQEGFSTEEQTLNIQPELKVVEPQNLSEKYVIKNNDGSNHILEGTNIELITDHPQLNEILERIAKITDEGLTPEMWDKVRNQLLEKQINHLKNAKGIMNRPDLYSVLSMYEGRFAETYFSVIVEESIKDIPNAKIFPLQNGMLSFDGQYKILNNEKQGFQIVNQSSEDKSKIVAEYDGFIIVKVMTDKGEIDLPIVIEQKNSISSKSIAFKDGLDKSLMTDKLRYLSYFIHQKKISNNNELEDVSQKKILMSYILVAPPNPINQELKREQFKNSLDIDENDNDININIERKTKDSRENKSIKVKKTIRNFINKGGIILKGPLDAISMHMMFYKMMDSLTYEELGLKEPKVKDDYKGSNDENYNTESNLETLNVEKLPKELFEFIEKVRNIEEVLDPEIYSNLMATQSEAHSNKITIQNTIRLAANITHLVNIGEAPPNIKLLRDYQEQYPEAVRVSKNNLLIIEDFTPNSNTLFFTYTDSHGEIIPVCLENIGDTTKQYANRMQRKNRMMNYLKEKLGSTKYFNIVYVDSDSIKGRQLRSIYESSSSDIIISL